MNGERQFENDPWVKACELLVSHPEDRIGEVAIWCVCTDGTIQQTFEKWEDRLHRLLGKCIRKETLRSYNVLSIVAKYENKAIVRMFFDDIGDDCSENFEIVTTGGLLIWKPDSHPQGRAQGSAHFCDCRQKNAFDLEVL